MSAVAANSPQTSSTQELQWLLTRKTSCFLVKQKGLKRVFSREPNNLAQVHSYRYSGLVNDKNVSIEPKANGKGLVVTTRNEKAKPNQIAGAHSRKTIKQGGARHKAGAVAQIVGGSRPDLLKAAVARSSAISYSQRPKGRKEPIRKARGKKAHREVKVVE